MNLKETRLRIPPKIISQTRALNVATLRNINEKKKAKPKEIFVFKRLQLNTLGVIGVISIADSLLPQNADNTIITRQLVPVSVFCGIPGLT